ncbi:MAG: hypothetical protein U0228_12130 [Myxococcaceae bacterium]
MRRMIRGALAVVLCLGSMPAFAQGDADCVLNADALKPQIDASKLPKGSKLLKSEKVKRNHRDVVRLADGTEVTLGVGGCVHLGLSFALKGKAIGPKLTPAEGVALIRKALEVMPIKSDANLQKVIITDALDALKTVPTAFPVTLTCHEFESCELLLEPNEKKETVLTFAYDFPL